MKKLTANAIAPVSAVAAVFALGMPGADAQTTPVFNYSFPGSWNGTGSTITDQSTAGNNGTFDGTLSLSSSVPSGGGGSQSVNTASGGILTGAAQSLNNAAIAAAGGFTFAVSFDWNGTDSTSFGHTEKLIDYAGTESLQLVTTTGSATLEMALANVSSNEVVATSTTILPNTWYNVLVTFNTEGNSVDANGAISGIVSMQVNGGAPITGSAIKGSYGDSLDRPIGIGQLGANFGYLVGFKGLVHDPSVALGVTPVPEPSASALLATVGGLAMAWNLRRRKL